MAPTLLFHWCSVHGVINQRITLILELGFSFCVDEGLYFVAPNRCLLQIHHPNGVVALVSSAGLPDVEEQAITCLAVDPNIPV